MAKSCQAARRNYEAGIRKFDLSQESWEESGDREFQAMLRSPDNVQPVPHVARTLPSLCEHLGERAAVLLLAMPEVHPQVLYLALDENPPVPCWRRRSHPGQ